MFTFTRSADYGIILSVMTHPKVWPHIIDDFSPAVAEFKPVKHPDIWYVLLHRNGLLLGLFMLVPHSVVLWEVHTCLLPTCWGDLAHKAAIELVQWLWDNTSCRRLITNVPAYNRLALAFAKSAGLEQFGLNERSFLKNGKMHDLHMLGVSKPVQESE